MFDYEDAILKRQDDIYDGVTEQDDTVTIMEFNFNSGTYETKKTLTGKAAREYMEENGIW